MTETKALGPLQLELLRRIVASNGGGVYCDTPEHRAQMRSLERRGLIQGKSGAQWVAVHTRAGLELVRRLDAPA